MEGSGVPLEIAPEINVVLDLRATTVHVPRNEQGIKHFNAVVVGEERGHSRVLLPKTERSLIKMECGPTRKLVRLGNGTSDYACNLGQLIWSVGYHIWPGGIYAQPETPVQSHLFFTTTVSILTARFGVHAGIGWQFSGHATLEEARYRESLLQNDLFLQHQ